MTNEAHTPWKLWNGYGPARDGLMRVERIGPEQSGGLVSFMGSQDIAGSAVDLERVVIAVNSHDALLETLKAVLALWQIDSTDLPYQEGTEYFLNVRDAEKAAKAAIALAEGRAS